MITTRLRRAAAMVFTLGIVSMAAACTVESGEEPLVAEEMINGEPSDSIGAEPVAFDDKSAEDFALMAADNDENQLIPDDESGISGGTSSACDGNCKSYHGRCSGWGGQYSSVICPNEVVINEPNPLTWTVYGPSKYAWVTVCGSCGSRYVSAKGEGYCWW